MSAEHLLLDVDDHDGEMKFEIRDLRKVLTTGVPILNGINVGIPKGTIVGIIGPSGSGKSTFLRALNRLWEPPSGTVFLDGRDIVDLDVLGLRRKVGMLFQLPALFQGTVADNIRYGPNLRGKKLTDEEVSKLLTLADLDSSFFNKPGGELSVGQAQRVALARTLANEPEVLLTPLCPCLKVEMLHSNFIAIPIFFFSELFNWMNVFIYEIKCEFFSCLNSYSRPHNVYWFRVWLI
ncbi:hypothetical protein DITRI_Ditri09bG0066900 [Diplodiscus trichospermus]